jgi:5-carboxyvanillate decarboxylase
MHARMVSTNRYPSVGKLNRKPSDYLKENFWVTTSGMAWEAPILYAQSVLGVDRVMYAMDYPYQFVPGEVTLIDNLAIGDPEKMMLYQINAERVFKL